jgi:hypothetical protein
MRTHHQSGARTQRNVDNALCAFNNGGGEFEDVVMLGIVGICDFLGNFVFMRLEAGTNLGTVNCRKLDSRMGIQTHNLLDLGAPLGE